jgi:hypothetical protein
MLTGTDFLGCKNRSGKKLPVAYLLGEGAGEIEDRYQAAKLNSNIPISERLNMVFLRDFPLIKDVQAVDYIATEINKIDQMGCLMIDALASSTGLEDLNDAASAVVIMKLFERLGTLCRCPIVIIGHLGKAVKAGVSGSHQWRAQADHVIYCLAERDDTEGDVSERRLIVGKNRRGPEGPLFGFDIIPFGLGLDAYGDAWTAGVAVRNASDGKPAASVKRGRPATGGESWKVFVEAFELAMGEAGVRRREIGGLEVECAGLDAVRLKFEGADHGKTPSRVAWANAMRSLEQKGYGAEGLWFFRPIKKA